MEINQDVMLDDYPIVNFSDKSLWEKLCEFQMKHWGGISIIRDVYKTKPIPFPLDLPKGVEKVEVDWDLWINNHETNEAKIYTTEKVIRDKDLPFDLRFRESTEKIVHFLNGTPMIEVSKNPTYSSNGERRLTSIERYSKMTAKEKRNSGFSGKRKRAFRVIIRDDFECKLCQTQNNLTIHHILPKSKYPHFQNEIQNLITLCRYCHDKADEGKYSSEFLFKLI